MRPFKRSWGCWGSGEFHSGTEMIPKFKILSTPIFLPIQSTYVIFQQFHSRPSELDSKATLPRCRQFRGICDVNEPFIAIISTKHHFVRDNLAPLLDQLESNVTETGEQ